MRITNTRVWRNSPTFTSSLKSKRFVLFCFQRGLGGGATVWLITIKGIIILFYIESMWDRSVWGVFRCCWSSPSRWTRRRPSCRSASVSWELKGRGGASTWVSPHTCAESHWTTATCQVTYGHNANLYSRANWCYKPINKQANNKLVILRPEPGVMLAGVFSFSFSSRLSSSYSTEYGL